MGDYRPIGDIYVNISAKWRESARCARQTGEPMFYHYVANQSPSLALVVYRDCDAFAVLQADCDRQLHFIHRTFSAR